MCPVFHYYKQYFSKVPFNILTKPKSGNIDNSTILFLRLLDLLEVKCIALAGFDGYQYSPNNYADEKLELYNVIEDPEKRNFEISSMFEDFLETKNKRLDVKFVTKSIFDKSNS